MLRTSPMIVTCPSCSIQFRIDPAALGPVGRTVRCSACRERWFVEGLRTIAAAAPPVDEPAVPAHAPADAGVATPRARRGLLTGWLLAGLAVLLMTAAVAGRNEIAAKLPVTVPLYRSLGLSLELPLGVEFRELNAAQRQDDGRPVLVVTGQIANVSAHERELPPIRVALLDGEQQELDFGLFDPPRPALEPGGAARFEVRLGAPPAEAKDVAVSFGEPH